MPERAGAPPVRADLVFVSKLPLDGEAVLLLEKLASIGQYGRHTLLHVPGSAGIEASF